MRGHRVGLIGGVGGGNTGNEVSLDVVRDLLSGARGDLGFAVITPMPEGARGTGAARPDEPVLHLRADHPHHGRGARTLVRRAVAELVHTGRVIRLTGDLRAVVVCGTGVLDDLEEPPWGMPWSLFLWSVAARVRRRPFVLLAVGAGPVVGRVSARLFRATVALATEVTYRDERSARTMAELGAGREDARVTCDLAFGHRIDPAPPASPGPGMGVAVSVMDWKGWSGGDTQEAERYLATLVEVVVGLLDRGHRVVLVVGQPVDLSPAAEVRRRVMLQRPDASLPPATSGSFDDLVRRVQGVDLVVATRFHTVVAALMADRPVVSSGYAPKNAALLARVGLPDADRGVEDTDATWVLDRVDAIAAGDLAWRADREVVSRWGRDVRDEVAGLATRIVPATTVADGDRRPRARPTSRRRGPLRRTRAWWSRRGGSRSG